MQAYGMCFKDAARHTGWLGQHTSLFELRFLLFNGNVGLWALVSLSFEFKLSGEVESHAKVQPVSEWSDQDA